MRKFIVSDLHGNGAVYDSIIGYLENLAKDSNEEITLYINGDLIDRGPDTVRMFMDVKDRIENNKSFKIEYLAGNHELMMYQVGILKDPVYMKETKWYKENGGEDTVKSFNDTVPKECMDEILDFIINLKKKLRIKILF